jgi:arylformamidase
MSFDDLPTLPPLLLPGAKEYAERISAASRRVMASTRSLLDIPYRRDDYWQKLDIYLPQDDLLAHLPVFCFLHGGAWVNGCKEWMGFMAPPILAIPAIFVSASYRHAPAARFPAQLEDCCDLIAWLYRHIEAYGGAPQKIHFGGHSAGGHLAALTALRPDKLTRRGLPYDAIKACYPVSGIFDLAEGRPHSWRMRSPVEKLLAETAQAPEASPLEHVEGNATPFFISWGSDDLPDLAAQGTAFVAALKRQPGLLRQQEFAGHDHWMMGECGGDAAHPWTRTVCAWLAGARHS